MLFGVEHENSNEGGILYRVTHASNIPLHRSSGGTLCAIQHIRRRYGMSSMRNVCGTLSLFPSNTRSTRRAWLYVEAFIAVPVSPNKTRPSRVCMKKEQEREREIMRIPREVTEAE